jgi:hypothetical protein
VRKRVVLSALAFAAFAASAVDVPTWPPSEEAAARMHELQQVMSARDSTAAQREAAREELAAMLKSPAGRKPAEAPPPRAAIQPFPSVVAPAREHLIPVPPPPGGVARLEVTQPSRPLIVPQTGSVLEPREGYALDPRTGRVWKETPTGYLDSATGRFVPR